MSKKRTPIQDLVCAIDAIALVDGIFAIESGKSNGMAALEKIRALIWDIRVDAQSE